MKKIFLSIIFTICMFFILIPSKTFATESNDYPKNSVTVDIPEIINVLEEFTVKVNLNEVESFYGASFEMMYDPKLFQVIDISSGDAFGANEEYAQVFLKNYNNSIGKLEYCKVLTQGCDPMLGMGSFVEIKFKALGKGTFNMSFTQEVREALSLEADKNNCKILIVRNDEGEQLRCNLYGGSTEVTVKKIELGDINGDGKVSEEDYVLLNNNLLQKTPSFGTVEERVAADVSGDNKITSLDLALVRRFLIGKIVKFPAAELNIGKIKENYKPIISLQDKYDYEELGFNFLSDKCFVVDEDGLDLHEYVTSPQGITLHILEGSNSFRVENDHLYLNDSTQAMAIARVKLENYFGFSEEFYIYGTYDSELHNFTYDYVKSLVNKN